MFFAWDRCEVPGMGPTTETKVESHEMAGTSGMGARNSIYWPRDRHTECALLVLVSPFAFGRKSVVFIRHTIRHLVTVYVSVARHIVANNRNTAAGTSRIEIVEVTDKRRVGRRLETTSGGGPRHSGK